MSEEQLIRRAQQGDNGAFEELLLLHQKKVYNLCLRMSANPDDALDLSQEAFLRAWRSLGQYQFEASFSTWLFRLTSNICIDFLRRKKRRQETSLTESYDDSDEGAELSVPDAQPGPEQQAMTNETKIELARAMEQLSPEHREILQLRVIEDLQYEQIADILGVRVGTVKSRLARARLSFRKILKAGNYFDSASSEPVEGEVRL
ncbi:MAG: RNA polymerase sigma factor [Oscillospiraceae bacterium]|nr:sigma-70 family RNA polymerase sigma factor [Bacillota bacterium]